MLLTRHQVRLASPLNVWMCCIACSSAVCAWQIKAEALTKDASFPYVLVAMQECERMNRLLGEIRRSLIELRKGLDGQLNMSEPMEDLQQALSINQVPGRNVFHKTSWEKLAWPSKKSLQMWFADLLLRVEQVCNVWLCLRLLCAPRGWALTAGSSCALCCVCVAAGALGVGSGGATVAVAARFVQPHGVRHGHHAGHCTRHRTAVGQDVRGDTRDYHAATRGQLRLL